MCLGVPGCVVEMQRIDEVLMGQVAFGGIRRQVCLEHVADVKVGEYVLVHVGFALTKIDAVEAAKRNVHPPCPRWMCMPRVCVR